ncbi:MAG TPA: hypothetical protein VI387_05795 [Candidatus Brocadiales bacterium]|nr:hypothetical protein [Candidatus Brocadiales bacterium]
MDTADKLKRCGLVLPLASGLILTLCTTKEKHIEEPNYIEQYNACNQSITKHVSATASSAWSAYVPYNHI